MIRTTAVALALAVAGPARAQITGRPIELSAPSVDVIAPYKLSPTSYARWPGTSFAAPFLSFDTGEGTFGATSDLDADGDPDLVIGTEFGGVEVLLANGDGTFAPPVEYLMGSRPRALGLGDLDGDTVPDIVSADWTGASVSVRLGLGDGTFGPATSYAVATFPQAVAIADMDGDDTPDVIVTTGGNNTVQVLHGNGDGTLGVITQGATGSNPHGLAVADFNHDGALDVAATNSGMFSMSVLIGNGDGTFQPRTDYAIGYASQTVAAADFDGDGEVDLAVGNSCTPCNTVSVFLGQGERLEFAHRSATRDHFARGALRAAVWLTGRSPGLYDMEHVLGLRPA